MRLKENGKRLLITFVLVAILGCGFTYYQLHKKVVLEVGMFAGSYWDVDSANSYVILDKAIQKFEKKHPNVEVHYYSGIRREDYSEWFSRALLRGKEPDVFFVLGEDFNQFADAGILKDLDGLIEDDAEFSLEDYYASTVQAGRYEEHQYALPYEAVPTLMFVNKSMINREGYSVPDNNWTWEEMYEICQAITKDTDGDGKLDHFGTCNYSWLEASYSNGVQVFEPDGSACYFTDDKLTESVRYVKELNDLNQGQKVTKADFDAGRVAFMPLLFTEYRTYKTYPYRIKKYTKFMWDCIAMPAGPEGTNASEISSLVMGISNHTKKEKLAWEFLKQMTYDKEIQMDIFQYSQGVSVLKEVTASAKAAEILQEDMEKNEKFIDNTLVSSVINQGVVTPKFQKYAGAINLADNAMSSIMDTDDNIDTTLRILQRDVTQYLKR